MIRWLKFNAVGIVGAGVQLGVLALLAKLKVNYLIATALAVETAVLHNYFWHVKWTWAGRRGHLWRFHLANGLVSIVSNLLLMRLFTGQFGWPVVPANVLAITLTSIVNYLLGDRWVFAADHKREGAAAATAIREP